MKKQILLLAFLFLGACARGGGDEPLTMASAAQSAMRTALELAEGTEEQPVPASVAGLLAGMFFARMDPSQIPEPAEPPEGSEEMKVDTELLNTLVKLLSADVQDLLNRSANREDALDVYAKSIETHAQYGHIRLRALQDKAESSEDNRRRHDRRTRELRNEIDDAINSGNASRISLLTDELIQKQKLLGEADADQIVSSSLAEAYEDVLAPLGERLAAINANRDALIKGVKVKDMPGIEALKIIEYENGRINLRRGRSFF